VDWVETAKKQTDLLFHVTLFDSKLCKKPQAYFFCLTQGLLFFA